MVAPSFRVLAVLAGAALTVSATADSTTSSPPPEFTPTTLKAHFIEQFTEGWSDRWSPSKATKDAIEGEVFSYVGKWAVEEPTVYPGINGDEGLVMKNKAAHHAISVPFETPLIPKGKSLVVQYEVKLQKLLDCGGAYLKLLTATPDGVLHAEEFSDKTPYTIMFGPDRCGSTSKVHFIFRHANPVTGEIEEKHLVSPPAPKVTKTSALYTLIVRPDQSYEIKINNESVKSGSLLEDFSPSVNPPKEIDDPSDHKPADWVENPKITDPEAVKPEDWDEEAPQFIPDESATKPEDWLEDEQPTIPDPEAEKPEEWDDEDDGDWIPPSVPNPKCEGVSGCGPWHRPEIPNPAYKGKWFAPLIDNPEYKGVWTPRKIANPNYYEDNSPADFNTIAGLGFELWSMTEDILFDNIYIGDSEADAALFAAETFLVKKALEDALEQADKPKPPAAGDKSGVVVPDLKQDPIGFAKAKYEQFVQAALVDPMAAVKTYPSTAAGIAVALAAAIAFTSALISAILPSSSRSKPSTKRTTAVAAKKTDEVTPDDATTTVADAPLAEKKEEASGVRTRAAAAKGATSSDE